MDKFDLQKHMLRHCHCYHDIFYVYDRLYYLYYHCGYDLVVLRQFSGHSLPHENRNIRLQIVMGSVITGIAYSNSMDMGTCCIGRIGICAITITTAGNTSVRFVRTTKGKCM